MSDAIRELEAQAEANADGWWHRNIYGLGSGRLVNFGDADFPASSLFDHLDVSVLDDEQLFARAKELTAQHRAVQAEMSRRRKTAKPPALAQCGHGARDAQGVYCDDPTCPRYVPF